MNYRVTKSPVVLKISSLDVFEKRYLLHILCPFTGWHHFPIFVDIFDMGKYLVEIS
ncbi:MAG: hypothetical protein ACI845_001989 [Gammaproteobacteria bacterium]|jgi:hypothetical protein